MTLLYYKSKAGVQGGHVTEDDVGRKEREGKLAGCLQGEGTLLDSA